MLNLTLHCGAKAVDRADVVDCPTPESTDTWQPIPHLHLLEIVESMLTQTGLTVVNQAHALNRQGQRYFGLMEVRNGHTESDYGLVVGLRNSHDQSFPAGLVLGSGVFVCDNLAFSGEVVLARKHTKRIVQDLPQLVERAVGQLGDLRGLQDQRIEAYKTKSVSDRQAHHLLIKLVDSKVLPVTRLPVALNEFRKPQHEAFLSEGRQTAWTLMNGVTEAIKGRNLDELPKRTQALHGILDSFCKVRSCETTGTS